MFALPDHCTPTEPWLAVFSSAFHTCVPTNLAFISTALGTCSIISWLFAQLPQIYKNWRLKSASGLSIYFLAEWLLGDVTNLLGALLTDQAAWQVVVAAYYVIVDICLILQYVWYVHAKPWRKARMVDLYPSEGGQEESSEAFLEGISPTHDSTSSSDALTKGTNEEGHINKPKKSQKDAKSQTAPQTLAFNEKNTLHTTKYSSRKRASLPPSPQIPILTTLLCVALTSASPLHPRPLSLAQEPTIISPASLSESAGRILSWTSTTLYLFSRLPQIHKNFRRRSTSGLSPTLFIAAFFGNLFYSSSILTNPQAWASYPPYGLHGWVGEDGSERGEWVGKAIPFWLGAAGVLVMDAIVGVQFLVYGDAAGKLEVLVDDYDDQRNEEERGRRRGRWTTVSGWMRGWVPSPRISPLRRVAAADDVDGRDEDERQVMSDERQPLLTAERRHDHEHGELGERHGYGGVSN